MLVVAALLGVLLLGTGRLPAAPPGGTGAREPFLPSRNGFAFRNSFRGSPLPVDLGALGSALSRSLGLPERFGLCGGMCFAAHDDYLAGRTPPSDRTPPSQGTALYDRLYARQADSLGPGLVLGARFVQWMTLDDDGPTGVRARTLAELSPILAKLGRPELVHLGLVFVSVRETREPWHNHQVLAFAAEPEAGGGGLLIRVYDPNYPGRDDVALRMRLVCVERPDPLRIGLAFHALGELGVETSLIATDGTVFRGVRGVFEMPYSPSR